MLLNPSKFARAMAIGLLTLGVCTMAETTSWADETVSPDKLKQIADLEKQLAELQLKLKSLKEPGPAPKEVAPTNVLPDEWVNKFSWRGVGPATMGGRITSISVYEADPTVYWVATASGGLLKTVNNGVTFEHQFDRESTVSIGAVAVAPTNKDIVWVGTGEANPRNSVSFGDGVYKSIDGGKTWKNMGLKESFQIGDLVVHPTNPDVVYVAALGRCYGPNAERGLYKTTDGGKTWNKIHFIDDKTGVIDIALNPTNPESFLIATWERRRDEFDTFVGNAKAPPGTDEYAPVVTHGAGTGLYKTTDGGKTFAKLTKGLPTVKLGRIGLDWSRKTPNTVFAIVDSEKAGTGKPMATAYAGFNSQDNKDGGVRVEAVTADAPAAKAGLKEGDVITAIDGKEVKTYEAMIDVFREKKPNDKSKFSLTRGKDKVTVELTFAVRPGVEGERPSLGVQIEDAETGIMVTEVVEGGTAAKAGLKAEDIITKVDGADVKGRRELLTAMRDKKVGDKVKVTYNRAKDTKTVEIELAAGSTGTAALPFAGDGGLGGNRENVQNQQGPDGWQSGGVYKSTDGGESWTRLNSINPRPFYFSTIRVDPTDDNTIYVTGIKLARSTDGGKTFSKAGINGGVHDDQHALWINPKDSRHAIIGTDGGFYVTFDKCTTWDHMNHAGALGQFYHVAVDNQRPYNIYGGLQDNGSWGGPSLVTKGNGPTNEDWGFVLGGDGFVCRVDANNPDIVYAESQGGNMTRRNIRTGDSRAIRPRAKPGFSYRWNWNSPFILSSHNPTIFYSAANYVFRSVKSGDELQMVSPEITLTKRGSATALAESPRNPDVLYVGTDDGGLWMTKDGCKTWTNLTDKFKAAGLPGLRWVSTIEASRWVEGRAYVVFDGHRSNDDEAYVFVTEDFGTTWKSLKSNLPKVPCRVLREDLINPDLLYLGTEFHCYASIDRGGAWTKINGKAGLPTVAVHELAQPTTANDLVVATHGRSVWVLDVTALRQMKTEHVKGKTTLFQPSPGIRWQQQPAGSPYSASNRRYVGQNPQRGTAIEYTIAKKAESVSLKIVDAAGKTVTDLSASKEPGYHRTTWNLNRGFGGGRGPGGGGGGGGGGPQRKGPNAAAAEESPFAKMLFGPSISGVTTYRVILVVDGVEQAQALIVENDPNNPRASTARDEAEEERKLLRELRKSGEIGGDD